LEHSDAEEVVVAVLASGARALVEWGLGPEFLQWLKSQQWSDASRARLAGALRQTLTYGENLPSDLTELVQRALASLEGETLEARLSAIALTDYWELAETLEEKREGPQILLDLADEAIRENAIDHLRAAQAQEGAKSHTVYELFRRIGSGDSRGLFQDLAMDPTVSSPARVGYVAGRGRQDEAWLNELLHEWLQIPELAADAPAAVSGVPATPERVALAVEAVNMGRATLRELNAFMYGGVGS
jgi:hypothetical protein